MLDRKAIDNVRGHLLNSRISLAKIDTSKPSASTDLEHAARETNAAISALLEAVEIVPKQSKRAR